jgi:hypothetical protein
MDFYITDLLSAAITGIFFGIIISNSPIQYHIDVIIFEIIKPERQTIIEKINWKEGKYLYDVDFCG